MKIQINIEKKHALILTIAIVLITTISVIIAAPDTSQPWHPSDQVVNCIMLKVDCNGNCANAGTPESLCQSVWGSAWHALAVSCDAPDGNYGVGGSCGPSNGALCYGVGGYGTSNLDSFCDDTSGFDAIIHCCS